MVLAITMATAVRALQTRTRPGTPAVIVSPVVYALRPSLLVAAAPGKHHVHHLLRYLKQKCGTQRLGMHARRKATTALALPRSFHAVIAKLATASGSPHRRAIQRWRGGTAAWRWTMGYCRCRTAAVRNAVTTTTNARWGLSSAVCTTSAFAACLRVSLRMRVSLLTVYASRGQTPQKLQGIHRLG